MTMNQRRRVVFASQLVDPSSIIGDIAYATFVTALITGWLSAGRDKAG
jgi:hypothetical protein